MLFLLYWMYITPSLQAHYLNDSPAVSESWIILEHYDATLENSAHLGSSWVITQNPFFLLIWDV